MQQIMAYWQQVQPYQNYIILAIVGLIAGWFAGQILGGGGLIRNLVVGILGAIVGGLLWQQPWFPKIPYNFDAIVPLGNQIVHATIGALVVVLVARFLGRSSR